MNAKQNFTDFTVCRALFAGWVFTYHVDLYLNFSAWLGPFAGIIRRGYLGVDGFFILSGLILARVHPELAHPKKDYIMIKFGAPSPDAMLRFWGKRLARIYPVHLATIVIFAAILGAGLAIGWLPRDPGRFSLASLVQNIFLLQGWGFTHQGAWNYPAWSVSTEWAGYILFPILWYILTYFFGIVAVQVAIAGFTIIGTTSAILHGMNLPLNYELLRFFPEFLIGMSTARFVNYGADIASFRTTTPLVGAVFLLIGAVIGYDLLTIVGIWMILFAFMMQVDTGLPAMLGNRPVLNRLGLLSYAFYMSFAVSEMLICQWFRRESWTPASHSLMFGLGMLIITAGLAVFLNTTIEVPCRRAADRWLAVPASQAP